MEFDGHQMHKIEDTWLFDLTTFIGYQVDLDKNKKVVGYRKAFIAVKDPNTDTYSFDKMIDVPIRVLRRVVIIIKRYRKEALLEHEYS